MNFSIEVEGAASPLNHIELARTLQSATSSQDHLKRQAADQQLSAWQSHTDFYPTLQVRCDIDGMMLLSRVEVFR